MKISEENVSGVVSISECEIWKDIPGYTFNRYSASSFGNVRKQITADAYVLNKTWECKTSIGTYLNIRLVNDSGTAIIKGIHQIICLAFHGIPPSNGQKYEVNHKDGNKHNNRADNLEWVTRRDNVLHALQSGLRNDNISVSVCDLLTGEWDEYYSIVELSRKLEISRADTKKLISRHSIEPYLDRWIFKIDKDKFGKINRPHLSDVKAYDYVTGKIIIASNATEMQYFTGVDAATILLRTGNKKRKLVKSDAMIAGYVFKRMSDNDIFPEYSCGEAEISRKEYFDKKPLSKGLAYLVKNYITGDVTEYTDLKTACKEEKVNYGTIISILREESSLKIHKGRVFKRKDDIREWPVYSTAYAEHTLYANKPERPPLNVTDLKSNTTKLYRSIAEFAREIGKNPDNFGTIVKQYIGKTYADRFIMEVVKF